MRLSKSINIPVFFFQQIFFVAYYSGKSFWRDPVFVIRGTHLIFLLSLLFSCNQYSHRNTSFVLSLYTEAHTRMKKETHTDTQKKHARIYHKVWLARWKMAEIQGNNKLCVQLHLSELRSIDTNLWKIIQVLIFI